MRGMLTTASPIAGCRMSASVGEDCVGPPMRAGCGRPDDNRVGPEVGLHNEKTVNVAGLSRDCESR
jgi:hypothetical protein